MSRREPWIPRLLILLLAGAAAARPRLAGVEVPPPVLVLDVSRSTGGRIGAPLPAVEVATERLLVAGDVLPVRGPVREEELDRAGSRLESALRAAAARAPGRDVLLVSDGRSTEAGVESAAASARSAGGRVSTAPPERPPLDAGFDQARLVRDGDALAADVVVQSETAGTAHVVLSQAGRGEIARESLSLVPGARIARRLLDLTPVAAPYEVRLLFAPGTPDDDPGNDALALPPPSAEPVVVLVGDLELPDTVPPGVRLRVAPSLRPEAWIGADALVISNLPVAAISPHVDALVRHVAGGGRLVVFGGPDAGRVGGWSGSVFERDLLPFRMRRAPTTRRAWAIALDRSASMADGALEHVRDAVRAFLRALPADERVAILPFAGTPDDTPLDRGFVAGGDEPRRMDLERALDAIVARGDTDLLAAVEAAARLAGTESARERFVVVIGDGDPDRPSPGDPSEAARALARADARLFAFLSRVERAAEALIPLAVRPEDIAVLDDAGAIRRRLAEFAGSERRGEDRRAGPWSLDPMEGAFGRIAWPVIEWIHDVELHDDAHGLAMARRAAGDASSAVFAAERELGAGSVVALAWGPEAIPAGRPRRDAIALLVPWLAAEAARSAAGQRADLVADRLTLERAEWIGAGRIDLLAADAPAGAAPIGALHEGTPGGFSGPAPDPLPEAGLRVRRGDGEEVRLDLPIRPPAESRGVGVDGARLEAIARAGGGEALSRASAYRGREPRPGAALAPVLLVLASMLLVVERVLAARSRRDRPATVGSEDGRS